MRHETVTTIYKGLKITMEPRSRDKRPSAWEPDSGPPATYIPSGRAAKSSDKKYSDFI
jgi:hypothetical protein